MLPSAGLHDEQWFSMETVAMGNYWQNRQSPKAFFFKPSMFKALRILHLFGLSVETEENGGN